MIDSLKYWWQDRSQRERRLLGVLIAISGLVLFWLLIVQPLFAVRDASERRYTQSLLDLRDARASAAAITAATAPNQSVAETVNRSAEATGITFASAAPDSDGGLSITIESIRTIVLFDWFAALDRDAGLRPYRMSLQRNADATISAQIAFAGTSG